MMVALDLESREGILTPEEQPHTVTQAVSPSSEVGPSELVGRGGDSLAACLHNR
jgi:hypothetical protein